jgi:toxin ParE1/3/4
MRWAAAAERDIRAIWSYYAADASTNIADQVVDRIRARAATLDTLPLSGRPREDVRPGLRSVLAHPYVVFYRIVENDVEVVRVLHQRRNLLTAMAEDKAEGGTEK